MLKHDGCMFKKPQESNLHIAGGWVHESHVMQIHDGIKLWYCISCGCYACQQLTDLGKSCLAKVLPHRQEYLNRVSKGQWPKAISAAEKRAKASKCISHAQGG
eukprot:165385-Pyramimonas_sp.AAC.1